MKVCREKKLTFMYIRNNSHWLYSPNHGTCFYKLDSNSFTPFGTVRKKTSTTRPTTNAPRVPL